MVGLNTTMTNEEKRRFLADVHSYCMERRPYDGAITFERARRNEDTFWGDFHARFYPRLPKSLFKYRKPTDCAIRNLENDEAWFSRPEDFDDTMDSTINNDVESELRRYEENPAQVTLELSKAFVKAQAAANGVEVDMSLVDEAFPLFREDGSFDEAAVKDYLVKKMPMNIVDECVARLRQNTSAVLNGQVQEAVFEFLKNYLDINKKIRREFFTFCLAEESDNQAMWGLYADESRGFCIEYVFPEDSFLSQRMLLNLFPIYYGEKPEIRFFDILVRGIYGKDKINGITCKDYEKWFISSHTKDPSYEFQKEWRITFDKSMGGNLQSFPFATAITLGERIDENKANLLIEIARTKGLKVYRRAISKSGSGIVISEIL